MGVQVTQLQDAAQKHLVGRVAEGVSDGDVAFMGDDIVDLGVLARVGLSAAPADAVAEVRAAVHWVSDAKGGEGAARQLIETILGKRLRVTFFGSEMLSIESR